MTKELQATPELSGPQTEILPARYGREHIVAYIDTKRQLFLTCSHRTLTSRLREGSLSFLPSLNYLLDDDMKPIHEIETYFMAERSEEIAYRLAFCARHDPSFMMECARYLIYFASVLDKKEESKVQVWFDQMALLHQGDFPHSTEYIEARNICRNTKLSLEQRVTSLTECRHSHANYEAGRLCEMLRNDKAISYYSQAVNHTASLVRMAIGLSKNDPITCLRLLEDASQIEPACYAVLGQHVNNNGDRHSAVEYFRKAGPFVIEQLSTQNGFSLPQDYRRKTKMYIFHFASDIFSIATGFNPVWCTSDNIVKL
eukprot:GILJ01003425.1.p1 GENE.GILJ01003425.1~~GILJ01003425.1.p1  ORF type:complete len:314 (+),score=16.25 GILJ01003425.1:67-1008(+)